MEPEDTNGLKLLLVEIYTGISERHLDHDNDSCNYGEDDMTLEMAIMIDFVLAGGRLSCFPPSTAWRSSSGASAAKSIIAISSSSSSSPSSSSSSSSPYHPHHHHHNHRHISLNIFIIIHVVTINVIIALVKSKGTLTLMCFISTGAGRRFERCEILRGTCSW